MMMASSNPFQKESIQKIAIFRALQLGDMLCAIPAVRAIRKAYPEASITLIGLPWQTNLVQRFPMYFDQFIAFPGWPGLPERSFEPLQVINFLCEVNANAFDLVVQMQGSGEITNPLCRLFGARHVLSFCKSASPFAGNELTLALTDDEHEITRCLKLVSLIGANDQEPFLEFPVSPNEREGAKEIQNELGLVQKKYVCLHPGARDVRRRWPTHYFAKIATAVSQYGYTVLLTGSLEEGTILDEVASLAEASVVNLVACKGHVGIGELAQLIADSAGLISNDTGVSHIASALRTRSIILFSEFSEPHRWAPLNRDLHKVILRDEQKQFGLFLQQKLNHVLTPVEAGV